MDKHQLEKISVSSKKGFEDHKNVTSSKSLRLSTVEKETEAIVALPPDGGWGWVIVCAAFISNFMLDSIGYSFGIMLEPIKETLHATKAEVALSYSLLGPLASALTNRFGFRIVALFGTVLAVSGYYFMSYAETLPDLYINNGVVTGIGLGFIYISTMVSVGFYFEKWRAVASGIAVTGSGIGVTIAPIILGPVSQKFGWRLSYRYIAATMAIILIPVCLLLRPLKPIIISKICNDKVDQPSGSKMYVLREDESIGLSNFIFPSGNLSFIATKEFAEKTKSAVTLATSRRSSLISSTSSCSFDSLTGLQFKPGGLHTVYEEVEPKKWKRVLKRCKLYSKKYCCFCCHTFSRSTRRNYGVSSARPMFRDDIFYTASLQLLPQYRARERESKDEQSLQNLESRIEYHLSVSRAAISRDIDNEHVAHGCRQSYPFCSDEICRTFTKMLDFSLLKSPSFILLGLSCFSASLGFNPVFVFTVDRGRKAGLSQEQSVLLLSTIGIANTFGRLLSTLLTTIPNVKALAVTTISLSICGISTMLCEFFTQVEAQFLYASVFGLTIACVHSLKMIIVVDMLGLERLSNAFGLLLVFNGLGSALGTPFAGEMADKTGNYKMSFFISGCFILASSILLLPIKFLSRREQQRLGNEFTGYGFEREHIPT